METRQIVLNDGTIIPDGVAGYAECMLWVYFYGYTIAQAAQIFFDPVKTSKIIFMYGEMSDEFIGFTDCFNIGVDVDGRISVGLRKGDD